MSKSVSIWQALAMTLLGVLATGATAWLTFWATAVSRSELVEYVNEQAPWIKARGEVQLNIRHNAASVANLHTQVAELVQKQNELLTEQRVLITKFDAYLDQTKKSG